MTASRYRGQPVSEGIGVGEIYLGDARGAASGAAAGAGADEVRTAFAAVAHDRAELAAQLRSRGRDRDAGIVDIGALIAADSALVGSVLDAVRDGADAIVAVREAAEAQAALLAALPDPDLAQRAGDVRQIASAVVDYLTGNSVPPPPEGTFILVRREVDPADLIRLAEAGLAGAVSVGGGASSHAAIIARGLGLPMLAGADPRVLAAPARHPAILDAGAGELAVDPPATRLAAARARSVAAANPAHSAAPAGPVRTADGEQVTLLCNVASAAETRLGLSGGAAGVGLLRTEIPFIGAAGWPAEADHLAQLTPVLSLLAGQPAVVRLLDFSGDKIPPFLSGRVPGLAALLGEQGALRNQLRAILRAGGDTQLAVLVPMVRSLHEVRHVRAALAQAAAETGTRVPELGIMVEVAATAAAAEMFAPEVDFFSIGTNDLTSEVLQLDRAGPGSQPALAADPRVLTLIESVVLAARQAGVKVSVCGDAAADPAVLPLLIGLGVRTLSVGAARVPRVAQWIAQTDARQAADQAAQILGTRVRALCRPASRASQLKAGSTTPPRPAPRSLEMARAAVVTSRTSSSIDPWSSSRSAGPTTPIAPATTPSLARMAAAIPASPTVASWSSTAKPRWRTWARARLSALLVVLVRPVSGARSPASARVRWPSGRDATIAWPSALACHGIAAPTSRICTVLSGRNT
jgi:phosphoenolpyruvate-protein kinase (PTS system EI component)